MKQLYFSALSILIGFSLNAQVQLTDVNHTPVGGNMYGTYRCDSTFAVGAAGAGQAWTFTNLAVHTAPAFVADYTVTAGTYTAYPSASLAASSGTSNTSYYSATSSVLKYWGGSINFGGIAGTITYTTPAIYAVYPMALNTTTTSITGGSMVIVGNSGTFSGTCIATADASGTLNLAGRSFNNVIRVLTSQTLNVLAAGSITGTATQDQWDWYSPSDTKYPLLSLLSNTLVMGPPFNSTSAQKYGFIYKNYVAIGIKEISADAINIQVYPNPAASAVNFSADSKDAVSVALYDIAGKFVTKQNLVDGNSTVDVSSYSNGVYIYKYHDASGRTLKTGKLTVAH